MSQRLLVCTDLDRTLLPNGPQSESRGARERFSRLASNPGVNLAYVSGRNRNLVAKAIDHFCLPVPDFVIGDVGTTIYRVGPEQAWEHQEQWENRVGEAWGGNTPSELKAALRSVPLLRPQEHAKQNRHKLSYYVPLQADRQALSALIRDRLADIGAPSNLIWSLDEPQGVGLLDILPEGASKFHAIEMLRQQQGFNLHDTVFCGDSGNDIEVLVSAIPSVLVANANPEVKQSALELAERGGCSEQLYVAKGGFHGMNGNYSGGVLEGIAHYHPDTLVLMGLDEA